jgi:hypothetical protein
MVGVLLIAVGKGSYVQFAVNQAKSIRHFNPDLSIAVVVDSNTLPFLEDKHKELFAHIIEIDTSNFIENGYFSPGLVKLNMDTLTPFKETLYLDVDLLTIKSLEPLISGFTGQFHSQLVSLTPKEKNRWGCYWMALQDIKTIFGNEVPEWYEINSSIVYFANNKVFKKAREVYKKLVGNKALSPVWGNTFPDEIAFNIALSLLNINPEISIQQKVIYFRSWNEKAHHNPKSYADSLDWIKANYYFLGAYGSLSNNHSSIVKDNGRQGLYYQVIKEVFGASNLGYDVRRLTNNKHITKPLKVSKNV